MNMHGEKWEKWIHIFFSKTWREVTTSETMGKYNSKYGYYKNWVWLWRMDSSSSGYGQMTGSFGHGNELVTVCILLSTQLLFIFCFYLHDMFRPHRVIFRCINTGIKNAHIKRSHFHCMLQPVIVPVYLSSAQLSSCWPVFYVC
jgi:hypothetical protein